MKSNNYREVASCRNCKYVFKNSFLGRVKGYYCNVDKSKVPQYGDSSITPLAKWNEWSLDRNVSICGYCDEYKSEKGK